MRSGGVIFMRATRIYCRVIGCLTPESVYVSIIGGPGVPEGSFHPQPTRRVAAEQIPEDKRFPNAVVWFDLDGDQLTYVEPTDSHT